MKKKIMIGTLICLVLYIFHSTPQMALRTYVVLMGYPVVALTSPITDDDPRNDIEQNDLNGKIYTLQDPPVDQATQGRLESYLIRKVGFFYLAEHYGGG